LVKNNPPLGKIEGYYNNEKKDMLAEKIKEIIG